MKNFDPLKDVNTSKFAPSQVGPTTTGNIRPAYPLEWSETEIQPVLSSSSVGSATPKGPPAQIIPATENLTSPLAQLKARVNAKAAWRKAWREQHGDPFEALQKLLADVPEEVLAQHFVTDESGLIHVKREKS